MKVEHEERGVSELRRALSPSEADQARVFAQLERRIAALSPAAALEPEPYARRHAAPSANTLLRRLANRPLVIRSLLLAVGGMTAAYGWNALQATLARSHNASITHAAPTPTIVRAPEPVASTIADVARAPVAQPDPALATPVDDVPSLHAQRRGRAVHAVSARTLPAPPPAAPAAPDARLGQASLRPELEALQQAERALRDHQPARALAILEQCARNVTHGRMLEERLAASVVARCALSRERGPALIDEFTRAYPHSAYEPRVRRSCAMPEK